MKTRKILRIISFVFIGLLVLPFVIAIFVKKSYTVEREVLINKPKQEIFDYVKHLKNQDVFSKWNKMMSPEDERTYTGTDGTEGFIAAWKSKNDYVGEGEQEIVKITDGERVDLKLRFFKPYESEDQSYFTTTAIDSTQTKLIWGINGSIKYPMNLMFLMMDFEKSLGNDIQEGLDNLKTILEME